MMDNIQGSVSVLGSTGSVGRQALDVCERHRIRVDGLSAGRDVLRMEEQCRRFRPRFVSLLDEKAAGDLRVRIADLDTRVLSGEEGASRIASESDCGMVINAVTGIAGLLPTVSALQSGKDVALANKETMVAYGEGVMALAREKGARILPVDSEHCAIHQCLNGNRQGDVRRLLITASGGPFYRRSRQELACVTPEMALAHPTWKMGRRITIDSATLMNKGFEVIEAVRLFSVPVSKIEVVIHPESIVHSMVEFVDRAVIAQMSTPDMRLCVQYALSEPERWESELAPLDFSTLGALHFEAPDLDRFPLLRLAMEAVAMGDTAPAAMNAADEVAVSAFLSGKIGFLRIAEVVEQVTKETPLRPLTSLKAVWDADAEARERAGALIG